MARTDSLPTNLSAAPGRPTAELAPAPDGTIQVPGGRFLTDALYDRVGADLVLTGPDGSSFVVRGYFAGQPAALVTPDGATLPGRVVAQLAGPAGPVQVAQAGEVATDASPIGAVESLSGSVTARRADGSTVTLQQGSPLYQDDEIVTADGEVSIVFADGTTFALSGDARMVLDEMIYDPATAEGSVALSVLKGMFVFTSGAVADQNHDNMTVTTPQGTIGIRGTTVAGHVAPPGEDSTYTVIEGIITLTNAAGTVTLDQPGESSTILSFDLPPAAPFILPPDQLQSFYGAIINVAPNLFQPILNPGAPRPDGSPDNGEDAPSDQEGRANPEDAVPSDWVQAEPPAAPVPEAAAPLPPPPAVAPPTLVVAPAPVVLPPPPAPTPPSFTVSIGGNFTENGSPIALASNLTFGVPGDTRLSGVALRIAGNYQAGADVLHLPSLPGISVRFDPGSGTLFLSGTATASTYESALRQVAFYNGSDGALGGSRGIEIVVTAANGARHTATGTITVTATNDAPTTDTRLSLSYGVDSAPTALGLATPTDVDGDALTITITGLPSQGKVLMADGVTQVSVGQTLSPVEFAGLKFQPAAGFEGVAGSFAYSVSDGKLAVGHSVGLQVSNSVSTPSGSYVVLNHAAAGSYVAVSAMALLAPYAASVAQIMDLDLQIVIDALPAEGRLQIFRSNQWHDVAVGQSFVPDDLMGTLRFVVDNSPSTESVQFLNYTVKLIDLDTSQVVSATPHYLPLVVNTGVLLNPVGSVPADSDVALTGAYSVSSGNVDVSTINASALVTIDANSSLTVADIGHFGDGTAATDLYVKGQLAGYIVHVEDLRLANGAVLAANETIVDRRIQIDAGTVHLDGDLYNLGILDVSQGVRIADASSGYSFFENFGRINVLDSTLTLDVPLFSMDHVRIVNSAGAGSYLTLSAGTYFDNVGSLQFEDTADGESVLSMGSSWLDNFGDVEVTTGSARIEVDSFYNFGSLIVLSGTALTIQSPTDVFSQGMLDIDGTLQLGLGGLELLEVTGDGSTAAILGGGTIHAAYFMGNGLIRPDVGGTLTFDLVLAADSYSTGFWLGDGSRIQIDIGSTAARLDVAGSIAHLAGELVVNAPTSVTPGTSFNAIGAALGFAGSFETVTGLATDTSAVWNLTLQNLLGGDDGIADTYVLTREAIDLTGDASDNILSSTISGQVAAAGAGHDLVEAKASGWTVHAGDGNDVIALWSAANDFNRLDGGAGFDRLDLQGGTFDFTGKRMDQLQGIEKIVLASGTTTLHLNDANVRGASSTPDLLAAQGFATTENTLVIQGDGDGTKDDTVYLSGWTVAETVTVNGIGYTAYDYGSGTRVYVETAAINVSVA